MSVEKRILMRRLAIVRYLYERGVNQSRQPEPLASIALHDFHDAVEMFLHLALEHHDVPFKKNIEFRQYWEMLAGKLPKGFPSQNVAMMRLNTARVDLKHHGITISALEVEGFRAATTTFFEDNCVPMFGIEFGQINLLQLVLFEGARGHLENAQVAVDESRLADALNEIAIAFKSMVSEYEESKYSRYRDSPFYFGRSMTFLSSLHMGLDHSDRKIREFVDTVKESIEALQDAVKLLSLGLDYRKYSKFQMLTPHVFRYIGSEPDQFSVQMRMGQNAATLDEVRFCQDFVIECALRLQEFDYRV